MPLKVGPKARKQASILRNRFIRSRLFWRHQTLTRLGLLGPLARRAVPDLEALEASGIEPQSAYLVKFALASIREESLTPYFEKLANTSDPGWYESALIVGAFGTTATGAIPNLLAALGTTNSLNNALVQQHACQALASIHNRPDVCVPALARLLESPDGNVRGMALFALRSFDRAAKPAWRELVRCLQDPVPWNRDAATNLLKEIDFEGAAKASAR
jgi:HEAT repeat protein